MNTTYTDLIDRLHSTASDGALPEWAREEIYAAIEAIEGLMLDLDFYRNGGK